MSFSAKLCRISTEVKQEAIQDASLLIPVRLQLRHGGRGQEPGGHAVAAEVTHHNSHALPQGAT